ncbi:hypothetical protein [Leuconostoc pseudomesenteroides]|uniref:hypothetical protein n=1 Tax=Leuconostoc pseudomesenteroides TaxID=33968 RepID=UPI002285BD12|nr:hypothetical protein [Leuconostoc pseudomesenteroides]WAM38230.1 hypothetical protein OYT93_08470 [Leuconostoc pseudomesenteroides]
MKKGIKKAHPRATKLTDEPNHKRPIHGFCYTHFNMDKDKKTKLSLTVQQVDYINSLSSEPLLVVDMRSLTVKPVNSQKFKDWLRNLERGGDQ